MKLNEKVDMVIESGIEPISLKYETVRFFDGSAGMVRSSLVVNSLDIGALGYSQYRFLAARSKQGDELVRRHITKLLRAIAKSSSEENQKISCYTLPVYARQLQNGVLAQMLFDGFAQFPSVQPPLICVEISADSLYEDIDMMKESVKALREIGVKIAITEVGDEFCPVFRLSPLKFDFAILDPHATEKLFSDEGEQALRWLNSYLHSLGARVITPALDSNEKLSLVEGLDCDGYVQSDVSEKEAM